MLPPAFLKLAPHLSPVFLRLSAAPEHKGSKIGKLRSPHLNDSHGSNPAVLQSQREAIEGDASALFDGARNRFMRHPSERA